jgi:hypothetical protein
LVQLLFRRPARGLGKAALPEYGHRMAARHD